MNGRTLLSDSESKRLIGDSDISDSERSSSSNDTVLEMEDYYKPLKEIIWDENWDENDNVKIDIKSHSFFYDKYKFDKMTSILEKKQAQVNDRRSFENKYWATTFFATMAIISVPFVVWGITYILFGKPRQEYFSHTQKLYHQTGTEIEKFVDNYCDSDTQRYYKKECIELFNNLIKNNYEQSLSLYDIPNLPKAKKLAYYYREKLPKLLELLNTPEHVEILPAVIVGIVAVGMLSYIFPDVIRLFLGNQKYHESIANISAIKEDEDKQLRDEFLTLFNFTSDTPNEVLYNNLKQIKSYYSDNLFLFWHATRDKLEDANLYRNIFMKMDKIVSESCKKR